MVEPTLFDPDPDDEPSIQRAYELFAEANPWVGEALRTLALELVHAGHRKIGIGMLFEVLRWQTMRATIDPTDPTFKLNNNYRSRYARSLMDTTPELRDRFELREVRTP